MCERITAVADPGGNREPTIARYACAFDCTKPFKFRQCACVLMEKLHNQLTTDLQITVLAVAWYSCLAWHRCLYLVLHSIQDTYCERTMLWCCYRATRQQNDVIQWILISYLHPHLQLSGYAPVFAKIIGPPFSNPVSAPVWYLVCHSFILSNELQRPSLTSETRWRA